MNRVFKIKILSASGLMFIMLFLLVACGTTSESSNNGNSLEITEKSNEEKQKDDEDEDISAEIVLENVQSVLESETPSEYSLKEFKHIYFTGQKIPEVYALYRPETASEGESTINIIRVYQYSIDENKWKIIYKQSLENRMQVFAGESIKLTKDKREQVVIGVQEGSGAYFSYILLGSKDKNTISAWLDSFKNDSDPVYFQGNYKFIGNKYLVFYESDRVVDVYKWETSKLIKVDPSSIPELSSTSTFSEVKNNNDIIITYSLNENQEIESNISNQETIFGKVGQNISLVREGANTSDVSIRILYSAQNDPYSIDATTGEILAPDIITVTIIPNGYDWDKAFDVYINALDDNIVTPQSDDYMPEMSYEDSSSNVEDGYSNIVGDADCSDFATPLEAQVFFEEAGPGDPHDLDRDGDGLACESN